MVVDQALVEGFIKEMDNIDFINKCEEWLNSSEIEYYPVLTDEENTKLIKRIPNHAGIYLFEIEYGKTESPASVNNFLDQLSIIWSAREKQNNIGKSYPKRVKDALDPKIRNGWIAFYLGSHLNLHQRIINEHISKKGAEGYSNTRALKLNRSDELKKYKFRYSYLEFPFVGKEYYICQIAELILRKRIRPIIGE